MNEEIEAILTLKKLSVICVIGTEPHERVKDQFIELTIDIGLQDKACLMTDSLADAIDYTEVVRLCEQTAHQGRYHLLEALAYAIAKNIVDLYSLRWVRVRAFKPRTMANLEGSEIEVLIRKSAV